MKSNGKSLCSPARRHVYRHVKTLAILLVIALPLIWLRSYIPFQVFLGLSIVGLIVLTFKFCFWCDRRKRKKALRRLRKSVDARSPMSNEEFASSFEKEDAELVLKVRERVAAFYEIDEAKIYPNDNLKEDYRVPDYEPWIYPTIYTAIFPEFFEKMRGRVIQYNTAPSHTILDLIEQVKQFKERYSDVQ